MYSYFIDLNTMLVSLQVSLFIGECFLNLVNIASGHVAKQALKIGIKLAK
jgi:hypothetical protein